MCPLLHSRSKYTAVNLDSSVHQHLHVRRLNIHTIHKPQDTNVTLSKILFNKYINLHYSNRFLSNGEILEYAFRSISACEHLRHASILVQTYMFCILYIWFKAPILCEKTIFISNSLALQKAYNFIQILYKLRVKNTI